MNKIITGFCSVLLSALLLNAPGAWAQGNEPFTSWTATGGTYTTGSFTGAGGVTWSYVNARGDQTINGKALTLRDNTAANLQSSSVAGGLASLTFQYKRAFSNNVNAVVKVNGTSVGTLTTIDATVKTFSVTGQTFSGGVVIRIEQATGGNQLAVDDIVWTGYTASATTISTSAITGSPFCVGSAGAAVSVPYTITGTYTAGNVFTATLSNSTGGFGSGTTAIGSATSTAAGTISATIPASVTTAGTAYRIRVDASTPATTGADNGTNLVVTPYASNNVPTFPAPTLTASTAPLNWTNSATCSDDVVIVAKQGASTTVTPSGAFTANAAFGSGTDLGGGNFVVYQGTGTTVTVTGLAVATQYTFTIFTRLATDYSTGFSRTASTTSPTITTGTITGSPFCVPSGGLTVSVPYTITGGSFPGGTTFKAQLSNASGSFSSPTDISTLGSANPISATLPGTVASGTGYRIRVVASTGTTGTDNGTNLNLRPAATNNVTSFFVVGGANQITVTWTNPTLCFDDLLIVGIQGTTVSAVPSTATTYTASPVLGSGTDLGGSQFVVYQGTGTSVTVTGLLTGTTYTFRAFSRRGTDYSAGVSDTDITDAPTITTGNVLGSPLCAGSANSVTFTTSGGVFAGGNTFSVQLSGSGGSFASPTTIATGATASPISFTLPANQGAGTGYRVRVTSTSPTVFGAPSAAFTINPIANATTFSALPGNGQLSLTWINPALCFDRVLIVARAANAVTAIPGAAAYTASTVFGSGDDLGTVAAPNQYVVYRGSGTGAVVTGLTNGVTYHFRIFTQYEGVYSAGATTTGVPAIVPTFTEVLVPEFLVGHAAGAGTHTNRLPYAFRAKLSSLTPNATYRYTTTAVVSSDGNVDGGGGSIYANLTGNFTAATSPSLATAGAFGTLTADAAGEFTGWFVLEPNGNARFDAGNTVFMQINLNNGSTGTTVANRVRSVVPVTVTELGLGGTKATGLSGTSLATAKNFVVLYDDATGGARPLAATFVESDGAAQTTNYTAFYGSQVDGISGAWASAIPNNNTLGVRRIEQRSLATGALVGCVATDADGTWNSGANTALANGGAAPVEITTLDAPLTCDVVVGFSPENITVLEKNTGTTVVAVKVTVANAPSAPLTVTVTNAGTGTATLTTDYTFTSPQNLLFPTTGTYPRTLTVNVTVLGDVLSEPSETIILTLTANGAPNTLSAPTATITIADDENIEVGMIVNEFSQGISGTKEFVECLVTGTPGTTVDLRGWVFDDNNGIFSGGAGSGTGIAAGHVRFTNSCTWEKVPVGSVIVFYNDNDPNDKMPTDDPTDANLDYLYVVPLIGTGCSTTAGAEYFIGSCTLPSSSSAAFDTPAFSPVWLNVSFRNDGDGCQLRKPDLTFFHGISFGTGSAGNPINAANHPDIALAATDRLYFPTTGAGTTYYFDNTLGNEFRKKGNWKTGTAGTATETPGAPNSPLNQVFIESLRQPYGVTTTSQTYTCEVRANETRTFLDNTASKDLIATVRNTTTTNYGAVTAQTLVAGTNTNTSSLTGQPVALFRKEWRLTPTTASPAAYDVTFYLTDAEITAYVAYVNSQLPAGAPVSTRERVLEFTKLYKISGGAAALPSAATDDTGLEIVTPTIGGYGTDVTSFTASFTSFSSFALGADIDDVLPVELTRFAATATPAATVAVTWATASEKDADRFEVQRSPDGRRWQTTGTVRAAGTTFSAHEYSFTDQRPLPGQSYYRLRQVDTNGAAHLSQVAIVRFGAPLTAALDVWPVPVGAELHLRLTTPAAGATTLRLIDLQGRTVLTQLLNLTTTGTTELTVPATGLAAGTYVAEIALSDGTVVRRRVVK